MTERTITVDQSERTTVVLPLPSTSQKCYNLTVHPNETVFVDYANIVSRESKLIKALRLYAKADYSDGCDVAIATLKELGESYE